MQSEQVAIQTYWKDAYKFMKSNKIEDISQLQTKAEMETENTIDEAGDATQSESKNDLIVLSTDQYAYLWYGASENGYVTSEKLGLLSESNKLQLAFLKPEARNPNYWGTKRSKPISTFINMTALVYFPLNEEFFAFGKNNTYCRVSSKESNDLIVRLF